MQVNTKVREKKNKMHSDINPRKPPLLNVIPKFHFLFFGLANFQNMMQILLNFLQIAQFCTRRFSPAPFQEQKKWLELSWKVAVPKEKLAKIRTPQYFGILPKRSSGNRLWNKVQWSWKPGTQTMGRFSLLRTIQRISKQILTSSHETNVSCPSGKTSPENTDSMAALNSKNGSLAPVPISLAIAGRRRNGTEGDGKKRE